VTGQPVVNYTYDVSGNLTGAAMGSVSATRTYDARNLLSSNARSNGVNGSYTFDAAGRVLGISEQAGGNTLLSRAFARDAAGQITGNVLDSGVPLATPAAAGTFDAANEITSFGGTTYTSDADGNRLTEAGSAGTVSYTWDARGRLQAIQAPGGVITSFAYDPRGRMIQKRVTSNGQDSLQQFVLDDSFNIASVQADGSAITSILDGRGPDDIIATVQGGSPIFPLADQLESQSALTDESGNVVGREFYEPFGAATGSGTAGFFQFTGSPAANGGLYYDRARFYDSASGRYLSEDPAGFRGGPNPYEYVWNAPTFLTDPLGNGPNDKWYGYNDRNFQDWYHRKYKDDGDPDATKDVLDDAYEEWVDAGKPTRDPKGERRGSQDCDDPDPETGPEPEPDPDTESRFSILEDWLSDHATAIVIGVGAAVVVGGVIVLSGGTAAPLVLGAAAAL
jgi:RHS repeat-associated protein